ncbi:hypothetical protein CASFOL_022565 [Castilleja foliolosa]|uniref:Replication factor A C-terminal domain-containing protein n=1 Tax=Castilleja foliolosa TaxID=1961234 RepID=A0ABD3CUW3_9LAMI
MAYQKVCDIRERQESGTIKIRVLKRWITKGKKEELCYQFVDANGDGIEATADIKLTEHFDPIVHVQSCYKVSGYVCTGPRTYMATVDHPASLLIGLKAKFERTTNDSIPTFHFKFANYDNQRQDQESKSAYRLYRSCRKELIENYEQRNDIAKDSFAGRNKRQVEITLWPDMRHLIGNDVIPGDIVAITSASVSEHNGNLQLESTYLTTVVKNPNMPQVAEHVRRLRALPAMQPTVTSAQAITIIELKNSSKQTFQTHRNFTCEARITGIHENRGWYYVLCSQCPNKLHLVLKNNDVLYVCTDHDDVDPNFRYCVNATITDATGSTEAVFFDESMQKILNVSCKDMVTKYGQPLEPRYVPEILRSITDIPRVLHLTLKNDGQIVVNNVTDVAQSSDIQPRATATGASAFSPTTPNPKSNTSKRQPPDTPDAGTEKKLKHA